MAIIPDLSDVALNSGRRGFLRRATWAMGKLPSDQITRDLNAVADDCRKALCTGCGAGMGQEGRRFRNVSSGFIFALETWACVRSLGECREYGHHAHTGSGRTTSLAPKRRYTNRSIALVRSVRLRCVGSHIYGSRVTFCRLFKTDHWAKVHRT